MVNDVEFPAGDMSGQFELQQPFGIDIVMDGFLGDDGDAEAAGNEVFDGFLVIDAGCNVELIFGNADFLKESRSGFAGAAALFAQDHRLFLKNFFQGKTACILHFQKIVVDRCDHHQTILIELPENKLLVIGFHSHKAQFITAFMNRIDNAAAVALGDNKIDVLMAFAEGGKYFRKNISRWNCRNTQTEYILKDYVCEFIRYLEHCYKQ